jgi:predicted cupin superfamily sugar epimerase
VSYAPPTVTDDQRIAELRRLLQLSPHPEGGYYREHFRAPDSASTAIFYLLERGEFSAWHRVEHDELWHWYEGAPIELHLIDDAGYRVVALGPVDHAGALPCHVVPRRTWQAARAQGGYVLVGNTVAPGFSFEDWKIADATDRAALAAKYPDARQSLEELSHP